MDSKLQFSFQLHYIVRSNRTGFDVIFGTSNNDKAIHSPRFVRFARVRVFVPAAVRIVNAAETIVVSTGAHHQVDLFYSMVGSDVKSLMLLRDFHRLNRFAWRHVKNIQQNRLRIAIIVYPLNNFVYTSVTCNKRE